MLRSSMGMYPDLRTTITPIEFLELLSNDSWLRVRNSLKYSPVIYSNGVPLADDSPIFWQWKLGVSIVELPVGTHNNYNLWQLVEIL